MNHAREDYNRIQDPNGVIPDDEPVFLLRGQDRFAARAVYFWADMVEQAGGDPEIVRVAKEHAAKMVYWPKKKTPDLPPNAKVSGVPLQD